VIAVAWQPHVNVLDCEAVRVHILTPSVRAHRHFVVNPRRSGVLAEDNKRKFNVGLSRARDRMVLFHSLKPSQVPNAEDPRLWTLQFFLDARTPSSSGGGRGVAMRRAASSPVAQLLTWLDSNRYRYSVELKLPG
jgi:hypothetical protein